MRPLQLLMLFVFVFLISHGHAEPAKITKDNIVAIHLFAPWHDEVPLTKRAIAEKLGPMGINMIVLEVNYKFAFKSHPELREEGANLTLEDVKELLAVCRENNIELVPQFNMLGHQSWAKTTFPLLAKYPELDETPQIPASNEGIYCRSWCPSNPKAMELVTPLLEEIIDAFEAKKLHVGMDEVFLIASDQCERCRGKNPAELFAKAVNDAHAVLAKHNATMMMWGDRLIDSEQFTYGTWEASNNGTAPAIDLIPRDIIICDWHYERTGEFASILYFQAKGFPTLAAPWRDMKPAKSFLEFAYKTKTYNFRGTIFTVWTGPQDFLPVILDEKPEGKEFTPMSMEELVVLKAGLNWIQTGEWEAAK